MAQDSGVNCTDDELERLLERTIAIQQFPTARNKSAPTNVSLVSESVQVLLCECVKAIQWRI